MTTHEDVIIAVDDGTIHRWSPERLLEALHVLGVRGYHLVPFRGALDARGEERAMMALMRYPCSVTHEVAVALVYQRRHAQTPRVP